MTVRKVCCIGTGLGGGVFSCVAAFKCPEIEFQAIEQNEERLQRWNSDEIPIYEPGLTEIVNQCRGKNLFFTSKLDHLKTADMIFVSTDAGMKFDKAAEMKALEDATRLIVKTVSTSKIVVEKSTLTMQAADMMNSILKAFEKQEQNYTLISNPEFLTAGCAVSELLNPERVLIGGRNTARNAAAVDALISIYRHWVPRNKIITSDAWSVELANLAKTAFKAQVINSINSIAEVCEVLNEDSSELADAISMDPMIGIAGLKNYTGFRGNGYFKSIESILYLCQSLSLPEEAAYWQKLLDMNEYQRRRFAKKILEAFACSISGKSMAVLGFSLRRDTTCTENSAAIYVCKFLLERKVKLRVCDPAVSKEVILKDITEALPNPPLAKKVPDIVKVFSDPYEAATGTEALIFTSDWSQFLELDFVKIHNSMVKPAYVFDSSNFLPHRKLQKIGFKVHILGKKITADDSEKDSVLV